MNPQISIVMPTYNRAGSFLKDAVFSILDQSFSDFELIVIDDASDDGTDELITSFGDRRIVYYKTKQNHGEYWSTNYGVNIAQGKYLTWVHSDDLLPKDSLSIRHQLLESNSTIDFVHGAIIKIDTEGNTLETIDAVQWPRDKVLHQYFLPENQRERKYLMHHTTIMMRWNFFYKAGPFDCSLPFAGDIDWLIRAIRVGNFSYSDAILYRYRSHPGMRRVRDIQNGVDKEQVNRMIIRRYV